MTAQLSMPRTSRRPSFQLGTARMGVATVRATGPRAASVVAARGSAGQAGSVPSPTLGHIFGHLPPFAENGTGLRSALLAIGAPGGPMDAGDDLLGCTGGPANLRSDPQPSSAATTAAREGAGMAFFGQFIDHDLTFDAASRPGSGTQAGTRTSRTARFGLGTVYGLGPIADPELYDPAQPTKLRVESGGRFEDLARRPDGSAIIGDPRNDANLIVSGLHAAFCRFHNNAVDHLSRPDRDSLDVFDAARKLTRWHYQWLVVNRILPSFVGQDLVDDVVRRGTRFFQPHARPYLPVEFAAAAYRFGHSMVRPAYRANLAGDNGRPFDGLIFDPRLVVPNRASDPGDLRGGFRSPRRFVGWQTFFDFGAGHTADVRPNKMIDTKLSTPLFALPASATEDGPQSPGTLALPQRTLLQHLTWCVPSGQRIASAMGADRLSPADLSDVGAYGHHLDSSTPLWLYVLREAQLASGGRVLGPVGGRIVAETMIGLLRAHPDTYLFTRPSWRPMLGARAGADYEIADFLRFAGVDPDSRGQ